MSKWKCSLCEKEFDASHEQYELSDKPTCGKCFEEWLDESLMEDIDDYLSCGCCSCCGCDCWEDEDDE